MPGQDVGFFDVGSSCPDIVIEDGDLKADNGLETATLISLFSNKRVSFEDLPPGENDRQGWWADLISEPQSDEIGSRLWTLWRNGKIIDETAVEMESILQDAFDWMLDDGIAANVVVEAARVGQNEITGTVDIIKPNGENIPLKFTWDGQQLKLFGAINDGF